jgi:predicted nucleic acid-binding protein
LTEAPAVDASPLIHLARTGNLSLLQVLAPTLVIPEPVLVEIRAKGTEDATLRAVQDTTWLSVVQPPSAPSSLRGWDLGRGEASVLAWAFSRPGTIAVLDDQKARTYAGSLGISVIGTLGIILKAKRQGVISQARPIVQELIARGMYLSRAVAERALALVGE